MKTTAAAASLLLLAVLTGCAPDGSADAGSSPEPSSPSRSASATPTDEPTTESVAEPTVETPELDDAERAAVLAVLESGRLDELGPYLADPVDYILAASECCGPIHPSEVATASGFLDATGWEPLPGTVLDAIRRGWYADLAPADAFAAVADDGTIVVFGVGGGLITSIGIGNEAVFTE